MEGCRYKALCLCRRLAEHGATATAKQDQHRLVARTPSGPGFELPNCRFVCNQGPDFAEAPKNYCSDVA